jgi:hypothetical protein
MHNTTQSQHAARAHGNVKIHHQSSTSKHREILWRGFSSQACRRVSIDSLIDSVLIHEPNSSRPRTRPDVMSDSLRG